MDLEVLGNEELTRNITTQSLETAAHEAAIADGVLHHNLEINEIRNRKAGLRRGKWTQEEEGYANRLIAEFKAGLLPLSDGTTLRTFLSKLLNCDPMRISKKFVGVNCIGKQVFRRRPQEMEKLSTAEIEASRRELAELERRFLERVAQTNRSKSGGGNKGGRDDLNRMAGMSGGSAARGDGHEGLQVLTLTLTLTLALALTLTHTLARHVHTCSTLGWCRSTQRVDPQHAPLWRQE